MTDSEIDQLKQEIDRLNNQLEEQQQKIEASEEACNKSHRQMKELTQTVRRNFNGLSQLLIETISLTNRFLGSHLKRTATLTKDFCKALDMPKEFIYLNYYSALFHDIGFVGEDTALTEAAFNTFTEEQKKTFFQHPTRGEIILNSIYNLKRTAAIIRNHHEQYDGKGFPDSISGNTIPYGSRILRITNDYDKNIYKRNMQAEQSVSEIVKRSGTIYDPELVEKFKKFMDNRQGCCSGESRLVSIEELKENLYLDEDILLNNGLLLIPKGVILDDIMLAKINSFLDFINVDKQVRVIG